MKTKLLRKKTIILIGAAIVIVAAGVLLLISLLPRAPEKAILKIMSGNVDLQVKDVHFTEVGDPESTWEIRAASAQYMKKENIAHFDRVTVRLIRKDGSTYLLTGDKARFRTDSKDMELYGNVKLISNQGEEFHTERLHYDHAGRKIYTDDAVTMDGRGMHVQGIGMNMSLKNKELTLSAKVRAQLRP
jgi:LPS export ABC transporter protein LptC